MTTSNLPTALELATASVSTARDAEAKPLFKQTYLNGWPNVLSHNCSLSFKFLNSLIDDWKWLSEAFGSAQDVHLGVTAYYSFLSFLNLVSVLKSGRDPASDFATSVPGNFAFGTEETQNAAYKLLLTGRDFLKNILQKNGISKADLESAWPIWMKRAASFGNPWGVFFRVPANKNLPEDLYRDSFEL